MMGPSRALSMSNTLVLVEPNTVGNFAIRRLRTVADDENCKRGLGLPY